MQTKSTLVISLSTLLIVLLGLEGYLRYTGNRACMKTTAGPARICCEDPVLGWKNKAGDFSDTPSGDKTIHVRLLANGRRAVSPVDSDKIDDREKIILVGGSFVFGQGLSDEQTMAWKLQNRRPEMKVLNYGVKAYGTYQSLLMLERVLPETTNPAVVLYGFMTHHLDRNTAPEYWRAMMNQCNSLSVNIPYVTLNDNDRLLRHPPAAYQPGPLARYSKSVQLASIYYDLTFHKSKNMHSVMQRLLLEMRDLCRQYNCQFIVAFLNAPSDLQQVYTQFCRHNRIHTIQYDLKNFQARELRLLADGHPNEALNTLWAEQTDNALSSLPPE